MWYNEDRKLFGCSSTANTLQPELHLIKRRAMSSISSCPHFVYELVDPRDNSIFYIGITVDLYARYRQHMYCDGVNPQKDKRIQEILVAGHLPVMHTVEYVSNFAKALERETYWIHHYLGIGVPLLNLRVSSSVEMLSRNKKSDKQKKEQTFSSVIAMLMDVYEGKCWPENVSKPMRRYYKRTYPEFFNEGEQWDELRKKQLRRAELVSLSNQFRGRKR